MKQNIQKDVTISEELRTTKQIIDFGLKNLENIDFVNDHYDVVFLLLSNGIERLLKITIILHLIEKEKKYPSAIPWSKGRKGHDIEKLLEYILHNCFGEYYTNTQLGVKELNYLKFNKLFRKTVNIISRFGQGLRYSNIDFILSINKGFGNETSEQLWSALEGEILKEIDPEYKAFLNPNETNIVYLHITEIIHQTLKTGIAILARLYTTGGLGKLAKQMSPNLSGYYQHRFSELP